MYHQCQTDEGARKNVYWHDAVHLSRSKRVNMWENVGELTQYVTLSLKHRLRAILLSSDLRQMHGIRLPQHKLLHNVIQKEKSLQTRFDRLIETSVGGEERKPLDCNYEWQCSRNALGVELGRDVVQKLVLPAMGLAGGNKSAKPVY